LLKTHLAVRLIIKGGLTKQVLLHLVTTLANFHTSYNQHYGVTTI